MASGRRRSSRFVCGCPVLAAAAFGRRDEPRPGPAKPSADAAVRTLADAYLAGYFERNPDAVTIYGVPGRRHDTLPDNSLDALNAWHAREDAWLGQAKRIDPAAIETPALRATYAVVREALEGSAAARVGRYELWTVSQMVNGWRAQLGYLVTIQPVGARQDARVRAAIRSAGARADRPGVRAVSGCLAISRSEHRSTRRRRWRRASISRSSTTVCWRTARCR